MPVLSLAGFASAFIVGLLGGRATARPRLWFAASSRGRTGTGPQTRIREGRRHNGGRNKAPRTPRPEVRPQPRRPGDSSNTGPESSK